MSARPRTLCFGRVRFIGATVYASVPFVGRFLVGRVFEVGDVHVRLFAFWARAKLFGGRVSLLYGRQLRSNFFRFVCFSA